MYRHNLLVGLLSLCTIPSTATELHSNASERTQCKFQDQAEVTVEYASMRTNGRKVFGGFVPYGKVWETGYKHPTTFVASTNLSVGGAEIAAGRYNLTTIPDRERWTLILKRIAGKNDLDTMEQVAKIDLLVRRLPSPLEAFTISFDQYRGGCVLNLRWEQTEASVLVAENK